MCCAGGAAGASSQNYWRVSQWGACSATCGGGTQTRTATCVNAADGRCHFRCCSRVGDIKLQGSMRHASCPFIASTCERCRPDICAAVIGLQTAGRRDIPKQTLPHGCSSRSHRLHESCRLNSWCRSAARSAAPNALHSTSRRPRAPAAQLPAPWPRPTSASCTRRGRCATRPAILAPAMPTARQPASASRAG